LPGKDNKKPKINRKPAVLFRYKKIGDAIFHRFYQF